MKNHGKIVLCLALVLSLLLGTTGTIAYLQDTDSDVNVMTLGNVYIEQHEYERALNADGTYKTDTFDDGETSYVLKDFTQGKPLYPAIIPNGGTVGGVTWAYDTTRVRMTQVDSYGTADVFNTPNAVDKFVTVENTGKSDAYVRTLIAFEVGTATLEDEVNYPNQPLISTEIRAKEASANTAGAQPWSIGYEGYIEIDNNKYLLKELIYTGAMTSSGWRHENGVLPAGDTTYPSLCQVYMASRATNEDVEALDGNKNGTYDILVLSQAVQAAGFDKAKIALDTAFGTVEAKAAEWFGGVLSKNSADTWDGTADTTWYNDTDTEFLIMTAEQLAGFSELVDGGKTFEDKTVKLGKDIDLYAEDAQGERISFNPIGYGYDVVFKGTFDGQGHTIENLYQNGWALGYDYSTEGGGLFASVVDATIKNLTLKNAEVVMECIDMGMLVGYSYGNCTYENISVEGGTIANYQRYTGGVVGEVNGTQTFKNVDVTDTVISSLWGDFDCALGGIIGGKYGDASITFEDCDVACELNTYNDITSSYQWHAYRRAGMLIGNSEETRKVGEITYASASYLTAKNCTVTYGDWTNYTYCEFAGTSWPYVRVQAGYSNSAYSNPRYGQPNDANGNKVTDDNHVHNAGEDHNLLRKFDQLYGGGQGVYGTNTHEGVTVKY